MILDRLSENLNGDPSGNFVMFTGASFSWFFLGVEWIDDHSGFFLSLAAMISTLVTIWGAFKANGARNDKND